MVCLLFAAVCDYYWRYNYQQSAWTVSNVFLFFVSWLPIKYYTRSLHTYYLMWPFSFILHCLPGRSWSYWCSWTRGCSGTSRRVWHSWIPRTFWCFCKWCYKHIFKRIKQVYVTIAFLRRKRLIHRQVTITAVNWLVLSLLLCRETLVLMVSLDPKDQL